MTRRVMVLNYTNSAITKKLTDHGYENRVRVLAQGDSWFAFPFPVAGGSRNLLDAIETRKASVAIDISLVGDTVENMSRGDRFNQYRTILCGDAHEPPISISVILLSAGGNDLIDHFSVFIGQFMREFRVREGLSHSVSLSDRQVTALITKMHEDPKRKQIFENVFSDLRTLIEARNSSSQKNVSILIHGYCYPTPRNAPAISFPVQVGPWIWKALIKAGITNPAQQKTISDGVIDEFNEGLSELVKSFVNVHYLDFRPLNKSGLVPEALPTDLKPTPFWHDEIHLHCLGWDRLAGALYNPLLDSIL